MIAEDLMERATDALLQWRSREIFPTEFGSFDLRGLSRELRLQSVFSARTTNAHYLGEVAAVIDDMLSGKINMAEGRLRLMRKLKQLGYDPEIGFPDDMADVPPAERGSLQDLSSESRINLMLETNQRMTANYGRLVAANTPYARHAYPAWELVRLYMRAVPRGTPESHSPGWQARWDDAGDAVEWEGALKAPLIALKDSPIWAALGEGAGGYQDTLDNPFPPFAFNSGMAWRAVDRARCLSLGLITGDEVPGEMEAQLTPDEAKANEIFSSLPADLQDVMRRDLADDTERESLRRSQEEFARREEAAAAERRSRITEAQEAHRKWVEALAA
jgi:hypothetical protein